MNDDVHIGGPFPTVEQEVKVNKKNFNSNSRSTKVLHVSFSLLFIFEMKNTDN